jgi:uncharacterized membrane protein
MISQAIGYGWQKARLWVWVFLPAILLQSVLSNTFTWHEQSGSQSLHLWWHNLGPQVVGIAIAVSVLGMLISVISLWVQMGVISASIKAARGEDIAVGDFFLTWENVGKYVAGSLLCGLIVGAGMILLIVPGIIFAMRYCMSGYYIVTQGAGPIEALRLSEAATEGHKGELFVLALRSLGVIILGALCLGVGLLWAMPTVDIAWASAFLALSGKQQVPA